MANPNGGPIKFQKGHTGNPKGRPKGTLNQHLKKLTGAELEEIANVIIKGNLPELQEIAKDPSASVIKVMIASVAIGIIKKQDMYSLDVLLNRLIGKVTDRVSVHSNMPNAIVTLELPDNGFAAIKNNDPRGS